MGATNNITSELNHLCVCDDYRGRDQVQNSSGAGMAIQLIVHSTLQTPHSSLQLRYIMHVRGASKIYYQLIKLLNVDNDAFIEFHPSFFIKD
jgi:hypothetical protein